MISDTYFLPPQDGSELPYYTTYYDPVYGSHSQRRIYYNKNYPIQTGFSFARWRADTMPGDVIDLTAALTGTGTLDQGFDELVPWPDISTPAPPDYPQRPHRLNIGDWLYSNPGVDITDSIVDTFRYHYYQRTVLVLPIVSTPIGFGQGSTARVQRFGEFLINDFRGRGTQEYLDLAFLGDANPTPCMADEHPTPL